MAIPTLCRACKLTHDPLLSCSVAKRLAENEAREAADLVANMKSTAEKLVANSVPAVKVVANPAPPVANTRGTDRHKDKEARNAYQRELMRKRRAAAKAAKGGA